MWIVIFTMSLIAQLSMCAREKDLVKSMPDLPALNTKWYSGFYNVSRTRNLHYIMVEAEQNPKDAPLVFWFAGGPGGSSMLDLFIGLGPFVID